MISVGRGVWICEASQMNSRGREDSTDSIWVTITNDGIAGHIEDGSVVLRQGVRDHQQHFERESIVLLGSECHIQDLRQRR